MRNRKTLHHENDEFIVYVNGNYLSKQWMEDVEHGNDWYDPHWREDIPRTKWNIFWYRYFGKLPWLSWNKFLTSALVTPNKYTIICIFVCLIISILGCTDTKVHCWKTIRDGECMSIKSYEGWNRCVAPCETDPKYRGKTKPYEPKEWIRPRPYVYP